MSWPQVSEVDGAGAVGFFGKLPAIGDFVHRRLPAEFLSAWDHWLQRVVVATRGRLGDAWLDHYMVAPFWRFVLVPGVIGPVGWMGVVMPSVDRVGRYFPFTLALPMPGNVDFVETFVGAHAWFEELEELGAQALHPQTDLAEWDGRLSVLPAPPLVLAGLEEDATVPLPFGRAGPVALPMPGTDTASCWRLVAAVAGCRRPCSVFSGIASEAEGRVALVMEGLPEEPQCHAFLDGRWAEYGWETGSPPGAALPSGQAGAEGGAEGGAAESAEGAAVDAELDAAAKQEGEAGWQGRADDTLPLGPARQDAGDQLGR